MRQWTRTAGLIFLAASSVYSEGATKRNSAAPVTPGSKATATANGRPVQALPSDLSQPVGPGAATSDNAHPGAASTAAEGSTPAVDPGQVPAPAAPATPSDPFAAPAESQQPQQQQGTSVSATEVNVSDAGAVEIHVNNANLVEVLRMLSLQSQRNIIASKDVRGTITANLYDVTVREALDAILHANGYAYREKGNFIYVYTLKEIQDIEKSERKQTTEVFRLHYTPAANAVNMIKPVLSTEGQLAFTTPAVTGIDSTGTKDIGGDSHATEDTVVVTDYPENLEKVRKIFKEIDRRPQQIMVEATILRASLSEDNQLGVDFNILGGVDFNNITTSSGQITNANAPTGSITPSGTLQSYGTGNSFSNTPGGFRIGVVSNDISVFLQALEEVTDTTVLANPKVLALNKQKGEVIVGRKDGYLTTTVTDSATVQTVDFLDTGTRLIFRPYIGEDGYIRMEIHPEDSAGGLTAQQLPFKVTTEVTSNVMVKDGNTIVIGGLFREDSSATKAQVPFLGNIPLAGALFRKQKDTTRREEVIVLLTPHIIKDEAAFSAASEAELREAEKLRVGVRKGMMFWGRERLAQWDYEQAVSEMKKPDYNRGKVLWHLNAATNLNPTFGEAIDLKQQVTGEEVTTSDGSSVRHFVRRRVLADRESATTQPVVPSSVPITVDPPASKNVTRTSAESQASAPATQPTNPAVAVATPATRPAFTSAGNKSSEGPAVTELAVEDVSPATGPAAQEKSVLSSLMDAVIGDESDDVSPVAAAPSTQPSVAVNDDETTNSTPATQPTVATNDVTPVATEEPIETVIVGATPATQPTESVAAAPSTQPTNEAPTAKATTEVKTTVTDISEPAPVEEKLGPSATENE